MPVAFLAVVSVAVIGLYLAFLIPIFLRWRMGDAFEPGSWTTGQQVQVDEPDRRRGDRDHLDLLHPAVHPGGRARQQGLRLVEFVNYAPVLTIGTLIVLAIWWKVSAKNWFTGPKHTIDEDVVKAFDD